MADTNTGKSGFIWYDLMTSDLHKAMAFYSAVVGWETRDSGMPGMPYVIFGKNGKDIGGMMSWQAMGMNKPTAWKGHIFARDVDAELAAVVADGGTQHRPVASIPEVGRFAVVSDPQGAEYLLFEPKDAQAPPRLDRREPGAVSWHELATMDWEKAWEFYSKHYGWTKSMAVEMGPMGTYQTFMMDGDNGGGMMSLSPEMMQKMQGPAWLFYFTVEDIKAAAQRVQDNGGTITHGPAQVPGGGWIVQAVDPQGGSFAITAGA